METSVGFRNELQSLLKGGPKTVIIDLTGVSYMDSSGIATLVEGYQVSYKESIGFSLAGMKERLRKVFELASLIDFFKIYDSVEDAIMMKK